MAAATGETRITNKDVREFWERHPVAASAIEAPLGTPEYFEEFDALREAATCEPYEFSNRIHGYEVAAGTHVLDVGCGNGYVLAHYARNGAEVWGIDIAESAIRLSEMRFQLEGLKGTFGITDGATIAYPDDFFDIACSMGVLHHISDPAPMIEEVYRVLRPGGRIIIMLYHRYSYKNLILVPLLSVFHPRYRGKSLQQARNMNDGEGCPLAMVYSRTNVRKLLRRFEDLQFTVSQISWRELFLFTPIGEWLDRVAPLPADGVLARRLGWNLYCTGVKTSG